MRSSTDTGRDRCAATARVSSFAAKAIASAVAFALATAALATALATSHPAPAFAETDNVDAELTDEQRTVEETAAAYEEAEGRVADLEAQIADNEARIAEIEQDLPAQRERGAEAVGDLYRLQQEGVSLIELVLGSRSIGEFLANYQYIMHIYESNLSEIERLESMRAELEETRSSLTTARDEAEQQRAAAADALAAAQEAREQAQREAEERAAAEAAARAAAEEQAAQEEAQESSGADSSESPSEGGGASVTPPSSDNADWSADKATFVASWAGRIDAYLAGSPLAGQGETFAAAAWDYGVDPRFSPAISAVESSKGAACFRPYNAWGWGSSSWGSWEEAISAHVQGLARGYGYTLTEEGAKRYCPPSWQHWYNRVAEEMNKI